MLLSSLNDLFVRVQNYNLTDAEVDTLIEESILLAGEEIRTHARMLRVQELDRRQMNVKRHEEQQANAKNEYARLEKEKQNANSVQAVLKAAEDRNGPRRGGGWNNI